MEKVKYRLNDPRLAPRRTRLEIPGWAGKREPRADGSREQVWHCVPFSEGAQYGIELFYPYDNELHVSTKDGKLILEGDWGPPPDGGLQWPPFRNFGDIFTPIRSCSISRSTKGMAIRTEPHPRFYTDRTDTVPIAVPALVRNWWPMMFFAVFKAPAEGRTHIFRPNEPFAQIIVIPEEACSNSSRWTRRNPPSASFRRGASMPIGRRCRPEPNGPRRPTRCSTAPIGIFTARRRKRPAQALSRIKTSRTRKVLFVIVAIMQPPPISNDDGGGDDGGDGGDDDGGDGDDAPRRCGGSSGA